MQKQNDTESMQVNRHFATTLSGYNIGEADIAALWAEISDAYTSPGRHYHNLDHLEHMLGHLLTVRDEILRWDAIILALCYHDIVYDPLKPDNEAQSAVLAEKRLRTLSLPDKMIHAVTTMILATKGHVLNAEMDVNLFIDADLSILGADAAIYQRYAEHIQKEYTAVPPDLYRSGRQQVLRHFLEMDNIFKTTVFRDKYEQSANANLAAELQEMKRV